MRSAAIVLVSVLLAIASCSKSSTAKSAPAPVKAAPGTAGTTDSTGVRKVPVEASSKGYTPERITAKPGEKLVLVFTRTQEGECLSEVQVKGAAPVKLPMNTAVEVPVTAPASGELTFACGMDMFHGGIIVAAS